jgi:hypothetical protein
MWFTVQHDGVPVGTAHLPIAELAAGRLGRLPAYAAVQPIVRAATAVLLEVGLFGAALHPAENPSAEVARARRALIRAASLRFELLGEQGERVQAAFVNLLEAPADGGVIVVAGFGEAFALMGAHVTMPPGRGAARS